MTPPRSGVHENATPLGTPASPDSERREMSEMRALRSRSRARATGRPGRSTVAAVKDHHRPVAREISAAAVPSVEKDARVARPANDTRGTAVAGAQPARERPRVCSALFFFPRGGSAQVARALARALPTAGWEMTLAAGSLGGASDATNAAGFYAGLDLAVVDYSPALELADPLAARVPFQPSYEDRAIGPDRVFAAVDDVAYERLVAAWEVALAEAGAGEAELLHLHHLTPANEAALRSFPALPIVGQLHGTELAFLRTLAGEPPPASWRYARAWEDRLRRWARSCERLIVPPGAETEVADLLDLPRGRLHGLPSGVDVEHFQASPLTGEARRSFWRRWLVEDPQGWDEHGRPGSISYRDEQLSAFASETVFLYLGRFTAVKRLPLLIGAHAQAQARLGRPCPLVLVGGHPGEWEGEHPLETIRRLGAQQVFLAGWRPHEQLPQALNAADVLVLPSVAEAFGLALIEAMACGLPVIACNAHGPAEIVRDGTSGWLVPPDDEQALADALLDAAGDRAERERRGHRAGIDARERYGWTAIATQIAHLYDELTHEGKAGTAS
jgi:glycosyltransferase involved in cell wall biosynthesis